MASEKESPCQNYCSNDPNFAIICSFFDRFALACGITYPTFAELQEMIENPQDVPPELIDLHVKLLRKIRRSVATEKWERALIKFCHSYLCNEEGWELERCGYKKCKVPVRLKILKTLLDAQFDLNSKFKNDINKLTPEELRLEPLGRDKVGQSYWCQFDSAANVRVYKEDQDEGTWALVAKDREGLVGLITQLSSGEELLELELINEDSNSQEVEKPIIDTGQVEQSTSEENTIDSVASKNENPVKEEDSANNDISQNSVSSNVNSQKAVLNCISQNSVSSNDNSQKDVLEVEKSAEIKVENDKEKGRQETSKCTNVPHNDSHDQVCPPINGGECQKDKLEPEQKLSVISALDSKGDISIKADNKSIALIPAQKTENECVYENGSSNVFLPVSKQSKADAAQVTGEIKDVTEEIKQRSLFKSSSSLLLKGKTGKSTSGSKLDKIFGHKLEQSNFLTSLDKYGGVDSQEKNLENKTLDDDSCSQTSIISDEQEGDSVSDAKQGKRKADELFDQPIKKQCVEEESNPDLEPEVGEEIEEPVMIIKGEGSGQECDTGNPGKDNEEGVTSENMNSTTSNKSDITLTNAPNENNSSEETSEGISLKSGLNNGILSDNCKVNEVIKNIDVHGITNCLDLSKKDDQGCNIAEIKDDIKPPGSANPINEDNEEPEIEKSIEEQLSDLTGEGLSPNSNIECRQIAENSKENVTLCNKKTPEKGMRRKSLDSTENVDHESIPPEAKKTKVQKDCTDIFGTDDSLPYSCEENKLEEKKVSSKESVSDINISKKDMERETPDKTKVSETKEAMNFKTNLCTLESACNIETANNKNISIDDLNNTDSKINGDDNKVAAGKEIVGVKTKIDPLKGEGCASHGSEHKTIDASSKLDSKEDNCAEEDANTKTEADVTDNDLDDTNSIIECKNSELKSEVKDLVKSVHKKRSGPVEENNDDIINTGKAPENEDLECPEKKKKIVSNDDYTPEDLENGSTENISHIKGLDDSDKKGGKSDSSLKDESKETANKRKTPLKKSPKPRRKVFTPKSRKNKNKNKDVKADNPENSSSLENKKNSKKTDFQDKFPGSEEEATKDEDSISENKEIDKTMAKPVAGRKRRNSRKNTNTEKESEEDLTSDKKANTEADDEEIGGKRRKVKGKRAPNKSLRKSIEDKRNCKSSSEEENHSDDNIEKETKKSPKESKKTSTIKQKSTAKNLKTSKSDQGKPKPIVKSPPKSKTDDTSKNKKEDTNDDDKSDESSEKKKKKSKSQGRNSRAYLGIDLDIDLNDTSRSVRQSSRIAQIKIKEQADHKHGEEPHQHLDKPEKKNKKKKDGSEEALKGTPKKKKKTKKISDEDVPEDEPLSERKKRRKKKKHPVKAFNERDPWKSSSGSSSEAEEEEEDHFDDIVEEEEDIPLTIKSDHEFSPESDIEADDEWKPVRRARTAQKVKEPTEEAEESCKDLDDFACEKCGKKDHPEWILLCDTCNHGWHASCLRPSLLLVPEGDWHCPPCQHAMLVKKLQETLKIYDRDTKRRDNEELRKKRLAYVGISLDNVLPANAHHPKERASGSESSESSESQSELESEFSDEPVYQLRQRRQGTTSYRFNEYDELINSAIRDEVEGSGAVFPVSVAPVEGAAVVKEGEEKPQTNETSVEVNREEKESLASSVPDAKEKVEKPKKKSREESDEDSSEEEEDSKNEDDEEEEEFPRVVPKRTALPRPGRKKHRKLNSLDDPSDDDDDDEDFKGSSEEEEEEEDDDDDSDESGVGRRRSRRGNLEPVRRSSRARKSRFDKEFINDDSDESDAPRRKKTKKLWSDSDSESDDSTWGRRKKKKSYGSSRGRKSKKSKKFTIEDELSDIESSKTPKKKRQRKIKYGGLDDLDVEDLPSRRTRGKKINYQEVLGTDSDEDIQKSKSFKKTIAIEDDEFDAEKEKRESAASSGEDDESENEEKSTEDDEEESEGEIKEVKPQNKIIQNKENEDDLKRDEKEEIKPLNEKVDILSNKVSPPKVIIPKVSPPKVVNKDKPPARRGRPPKAMIAPPPERLISEDEQYKAVVSKVATVGHNMSDIGGGKAVNVSDYPQKFSETKDFMEPPQPVTPVKIPNSSFDPKLVKRSPPIKIRSGVPVNTGMKSPTLGSPTSDTSLFPVKSPNSGSLHSPPDGSQFQLQRSLMPQQLTTVRKSINASLANVKTENPDDEEDLDDEDLMEEIEEEEEEEEEDDDEDDSDDDVLEEGEIPKKVARRMARIEERMERLEKRKLAKQVEKLKLVQAGAVTIQPVSPGAAQPASSAVEQKPNPTTQPPHPLLRVVSPLKLMANPPGPLQSSFMNPGLSPRMPVGSPPPARVPMPMRPPQPTNIAPGGEAGSRRGRGRGKKQEKEEMMGPAGGSVIRGMLQQPQSYPPTPYQQQYPPSHPRIPFNPQQRMPRPPFHPGHPHPMDPSPSGGGPINVKQEPGAHPVSSPVHIPTKPPASQPYHPQHRFDPRPPGYPPQGNPRPQYGSYPPPPVSSAGYHYGSYPPPPQPSMAAPPTREEYVAPPQPQYNEQFSEQPPVNPPPTSKSYSEEEGGGEFGGLVSYFSSQREEDIDT